MNSSRQAGTAWNRAAIVLGAAVLSLSMGGSGSAEPMTTGGLTSQPIGHYEFCKANPQECLVRTRQASPERMDGALWRRITNINKIVNASIRPMNDFEIYGKDEVWAYPEGVGDCEDYVLEKRRDLMREGMSPANLLITVVRKSDGEGHAVLTVRTSKGDFILDNLTDSVRQWDRTGYRFLKRQASDHTGHWVTIREGQTPLVGSVQ